ncbi:hypothetical protein GGR52DRAFT_576143 [Hypoxylon sp. FL1284]|nr:hypothetical protein GGR52DRAFT_576143 [Hypoxylon sp. FL1284]
MKHSDKGKPSPKKPLMENQYRDQHLTLLSRAEGSTLTPAPASAGLPARPTPLLRPGEASLPPRPTTVVRPRDGGLPPRPGAMDTPINDALPPRPDTVPRPLVAGSDTSLSTSLPPAPPSLPPRPPTPANDISPYYEGYMALAANRAALHSPIGGAGLGVGYHQDHQQEHHLQSRPADPRPWQSRDHVRANLAQARPSNLPSAGTPALPSSVPARPTTAAENNARRAAPLANIPNSQERMPRMPRGDQQRPGHVGRRHQQRHQNRLRVRRRARQQQHEQQYDEDVKMGDADPKV